MGTVAALVPVWQGSADRRAPCCATPPSAYGLTALLYLPWIPILLSQAAHTGAPWAERPTGQDILNGLTTVLADRRRRWPSPSAPASA